MAQQIIIKGTPVVAANEVLVADSNSKIPAVDGSAITAMAGGNVGSGTIPTARLDTGTAANKLVVLTGSGLPAVDGSLLTGIVSHTTSASDPTVSTNPSGGVGSEWINSTSGKQFICTDATAGANVWKCSGGGSGNVQPWYFQGLIAGYTAQRYEPNIGFNVTYKGKKKRVSILSPWLIDELITRFVDIWYALPFLMVALVVTLIFGRGLTVLMGVLALIAWSGFVRVIRAQTLIIRELDFVASA